MIQNKREVPKRRPRTGVGRGWGGAGLGRPWRHHRREFRSTPPPLVSHAGRLVTPSPGLGALPLTGASFPRQGVVHSGCHHPLRSVALLVSNSDKRGYSMEPPEAGAQEHGCRARRRRGRTKPLRGDRFTLLQILNQVPGPLPHPRPAPGRPPPRSAPCPSSDAPRLRCSAGRQSSEDP